MDEFYVFNRALTPDEILQLVNAPPPMDCGDFNGDEVVDRADYEILVANFNTRGGFEAGDCTFDGRVDLKDFRDFREAFAAVQQGVAVVPEPAAVYLVVIGLVASFGCRTVHLPINILSQKRLPPLSDSGQPRNRCRCYTKSDRVNPVHARCW